MNISPVSFGKIVEVRGKTKSTAYNIASLANSQVENKSHKAIQQDAKKLFDDVTPKGKVRVYETPSGETFLLSGKDAEFVKYGVMHRNSYICAPKHLNFDYSVKGVDNLYIAGQLSGVEGYMESTASGLIAGMFLSKKILGESIAFLPKTTIMGAITNYITTADADNFQPMNANFGILPELSEKIKDKQLKKQAYSARAVFDMKEFKEKLENDRI